MNKNYYTILGVPPDATLAEIRAAYRRRAKEYHPDKQGGDREAFLELQEAYSVLSDPEQRLAYDRHLEEIRKRTLAATTVNRRTWQAGTVPEPLADIRLRTSLRRARPRWWSQETSEAAEETLFADLQETLGTVSPFSMEIPLTAHQAWTGGQARVTVPLRVVCPNCRGFPYVGPFGCPRCAGTGSIVREIRVTVSYPPRLSTDYAVVVPVYRVGDNDFYLTVLFTLSDPLGF